MPIPSVDAVEEVRFPVGDFAIDPKGREWCQSYVDSSEFEKIKELAEANARK